MSAPLQYLTGEGTQAREIATLVWLLGGISIAVVAIFCALVLGGSVRRPAGTGLSSHPTGLGWITIGVGISSVFLLIAVFWTMRVLASTSTPRDPAPFTIKVTGEQWWWKAEYESDDPTRVFSTANEIHIPVGRPVRIKLAASDVIHSFWIPALAGKTDAVPGLTNETWLEADKPGRYVGQCTEFCGLQHAHMGLIVVADTPADFAAWYDTQVAPVPTDSGGTTGRGEAAFVYRCGVCHTVRGTPAGGTVAPDLTHLMSRGSIAANTAPNTVGNLSAWIADPQGLKPGNRMPVLNLSGPELSDIRDFLLTLK